MPDTPFWHETATIGRDDQTPVLSPFDAEAPTIATGAMLKAATRRRRKRAEVAARELADHALVNQAMASISWEAVAQKSAEPLAVVDQFLYRTARQITKVLEAAGLPHSTPEDWKTPDAQEAIAQADLSGLPSIPEARDFGEQTRARHQQSILDVLNVPEARRHAARALLIEAWVSIASEVYGAKKGEDAPETITAVLQERLATAVGWRWVETLHLDMADALQSPNVQSQAVPNVPAFDDDGYGRTHNDIVAIGARHMLSAAPSRWNIGVEAWPEFTHENSSGKALYSPSRAHFPTARDAMRAVESYSPAHVAMLRYITAKHLANNAHKTSGPYGGFYVSIEDFLSVVGRAKHSKGGYRPEDRREVVELVDALERIEVAGSVEGYERGKRGRKSTLTIRSPLIVVSHRVTQSGIPGSEERPIAWYLRAGDWAAELERFGLQYAVMTKSLLQLNTQNDMHAFNLGNFLTEQYRIRANQQTWKQPYRVCKLLEGAEIDVDRKHAGRFRKRIEAALDVLSNPVDMQGPPIIESWHYSNVVEARGRGWLDRWLVDSGIIIMPPAGLITPYQDMGRRRRTSQPKQLAG